MMLRLAEASNVMLLMLFIMSIGSYVRTPSIHSLSAFIIHITEWYVGYAVDEAYVQDIPVHLAILVSFYSFLHQSAVPRLLVPRQHRRLLALLFLYALVLHFHQLLLRF